MLNRKACIFIGLNIVRLLSITTLLLVFASSIDTMVNDVHAVQRGQTAFMVVSNDTSTDTNSTAYVECDYIGCVARTPKLNPQPCCSTFPYLPSFFRNSTVPNQPAGPFWAILNRLFIIFQCILLLLSEVGWPDRFFSSFLPVLGSEYGVFILGSIECL
jgi:hypothetical protein